MPEPTSDVSRDPPRDPDPGLVDAQLLQTTALRYAAGDLTGAEAGTFEARLASDQDARDALSEAVRLSAAALGQSPPAPHRSFRAAIRERLAGWPPGWFARRAYRGHPLAWTGIGAVTIAACTILGLSLAYPEPSVSGISPPSLDPHPEVAVAPEPWMATSEPVADVPNPHGGVAIALATALGVESAVGTTRSVAEIWADLSTPDHVEKTHDEEVRWRQKLREIGSLHSGRPVPSAVVADP